MTTISSKPAAAVAAVIERLSAWPGDHRVAVGLSGGVDSSLTAALLRAAGWQVEGLTLWLMSGKGACCAEGLVDAAGLCEELGIPHHVVDSRQTFQQEIVQFLVQGYSDGTTPLPCRLGSSPSRTPAQKPGGWACAPLKSPKVRTSAWLTITAR